jgi:DNA-binding response OmpR family regulator
VSKLLIVEDDVSFASAMQDILTQENWKTEVTHSGLDALQLIYNFSYDLVLLDWDLPDLTGIEVCRQVRAAGLQVPIVFLTGKVDISFLETAFEYGADDYVEKQAEIRELLARLRGVLRKKANTAGVNVTVGDASLNTKLRTLVLGKEHLTLTSTETELLEFLMRHVGEAYSSPELFDAVWESSSTVNFETVRVHINTLRKKLALIGRKGFIKTLPSKGYTIDLQD